MEIEIGDWVKVRCGDGLCRICEVVEVVGEFVGLDVFGFTFKNRVLEVRKKNNGNKKEKEYEYEYEDQVDKTV